jgi:hypothetical protein
MQKCRSMIMIKLSTQTGSHGQVHTIRLMWSHIKAQGHCVHGGVTRPPYQAWFPRDMWSTEIARSSICNWGLGCPWIDNLSGNTQLHGHVHEIATLPTIAIASCVVLTVTVVSPVHTQQQDGIHFWYWAQYHAGHHKVHVSPYHCLLKHS